MPCPIGIILSGKGGTLVVFSVGEEEYPLTVLQVLGEVACIGAQVPSYLVQNSSIQSRFLQLMGSWRTSGYSLYSTPSPENWSLAHQPQYANFPDWQQSFPLPCILLQRHSPQYMPPSWQQKTPCPCRMPSTLYPLYSLPCLYRQTTYSPCEQEGGGGGERMVGGCGGDCEGKKETPYVLTIGVYTALEGGGGVQVWYMGAWCTGRLLSAADFRLDQKQPELFLAFGVSASKPRYYSGTTMRFSSMTVRVVYLEAGKMLRRGRVGQIQLGAMGIMRADWSRGYDDEGQREDETSELVWV